MNNELEIYTSSLKDDPVIDQILSFLDQYNYNHVERNIKPFIISFKKNESLIGGAQCVSVWDWMHIKLMWVKESERKKGYGTKIIDRIQQEAIKRKCIGMHLDTYSFQAKDFYLQFGFKIFGHINDHPKGHVRYYLKKEFSS